MNTTAAIATSNQPTDDGISGTRRSELCTYVLDDLLKPWAENRETIELKWKQNIDDFRSLSEDTWKAKEGEGWRSRTQFNVARTKIVSAFALVSDLILQGGRIPFRLDADNEEKDRAELGGPEAQQDLDNRIEAMTSIITDQLARAKADRAFIKAILSGAIYGEMWLQTYSKTFRTRSFKLVQDTVSGMAPQSQRYEEVQHVEDGLALRYVSPWNMFWDMEAEEDDDSEGYIEREDLTTHQLRQKMGQPFYDDEAIIRVIDAAKKRWEVGPATDENNARTTPQREETYKRSKTIRFLKCWVVVPREHAIQYERQVAEGAMDPESMSGVSENDIQNGDNVWVHVCIADKEIVRYVPIEREDIPYFRALWEFDLDTAQGRGVADNVHDVGVALRGAARAFEDNKKLSGNVETAIIPKLFESIPKERVPGGIYKLSDDATDVRAAMMPIITPDVGQSLLAAIELFRQLLDEVSQVPKISQGMSPIGNAPDTAYEISKLAEASGKYIGNIVLSIDNGEIEPIVERFVRWNMLQPNNAAFAGGFKVQALGFSSFQDQVLQTQRLMQFFQFALSTPAALAELKVRDILIRIAKSMRLDPDEVLLTVQEKQKAMESQQAMQDPMLKLAVAEKEAGIGKTQADTQKSQTEAMVSVERLKLDRAKAVKELMTPRPEPVSPDQASRGGAMEGQKMMPQSGMV